MLIATGEMGRTPRINKNGGRHHWGRIAPLLIYGGGEFAQARDLANRLATVANQEPYHTE